MTYATNPKSFYNTRLTERGREMWDETLRWLDEGGDAEVRFDYEHWFDDGECGTTACIGGYLCILHSLEKFSEFSEQIIDQIDERDLGQVLIKSDMTLAEVNALDALFYQGIAYHPNYKMAAEAVRDYLRTGHVNWESYIR